MHFVYVLITAICKNIYYVYYIYYVGPEDKKKSKFKLLKLFMHCIVVRYLLIYV